MLICRQDGFRYMGLSWVSPMLLQCECAAFPLHFCTAYGLLIELYLFAQVNYCYCDNSYEEKVGLARSTSFRLISD